jgi:hypothetical protein
MDQLRADVSEAATSWGGIDNPIGSTRAPLLYLRQPKTKSLLDFGIDRQHTIRRLAGMCGRLLWSDSQYFSPLVFPRTPPNWPASIHNVIPQRILHQFGTGRHVHFLEDPPAIGSHGRWA